MSDRPSVTVEGSHAFYRASASGFCGKALAAMRMGMDPIQPNADMRRRFKDGHLHEASILEEVELQTNQAVVRRQEEWTIQISPRITVVGHVDGVADGDLRPVEAKSASKDSYADWERGVASWFKAHPNYADQWTLTLAGFEQPVGYYAVKNKDSGKVLIREVGPQSTLGEIKLRLIRIDLEGRRGKLPECDRKDGFCSMWYLHDEKEQTVEQDHGEILAQLSNTYLEAKEAADRAEAVKKELLRRIGEEMGDRDKVRAGENLVSMVSWRRSRWDEDKLAGVVGDLEPFKVWSEGRYPRVTRPKERGDET